MATYKTGEKERGYVVHVNSLRGHMVVVVLYATTNQGKLGEARACFDLAGGAAGIFEVRGVAVDVDEVQGACGEIAQAKLEAVHAKLLETKPDALDGVDYLVAEDGGLALDAMGGFPGPYIKPMMQAMQPKGGADALASMIQRLGTDGATALCSMAVRCVRAKQTAADAVHFGKLRGRIVPPRSGADTAAHGGALSWGPMFEPDGRGGRGIDEFSLEEQARFSHRRQAVQSFVDGLRSRL